MTTATHCGKKHIFMGPHYALGHTCGATGVKNEIVVPRTLAKITRFILGLLNKVVIHCVNIRESEIAIVIDRNTEL